MLAPVLLFMNNRTYIGTFGTKNLVWIYCLIDMSCRIVYIISYLFNIVKYNKYF